MNWTEGNLSRHSKGRQRNELLTRQKQHFAKVRNGLLNGSIKQSPISISFLGAQSSRGSRRREGSSSVVYRPLSSPLLSEKRKRTPDVSDDPEHQLFIRENKRRLLDQEDWVGLNLQQPINITFPGQLQTLTGSRWAKSGRSQPRAVQRRRESPNHARLEATQEAHGRPFTIQIGNQEINPNLSTVSRRYSLAPQPLASSSQMRSNPISSPEPSHARHIYVPPTKRNQSIRIPKDIPDNITEEKCDTYPTKHVRTLVPEEPTYVVHSSSIIHEPIPCRKHSNLMVLDWSPTPSGPDDWGSMRVEIERPARPAPSQEAEQEFWKNWVANSSDNLPLNISTSSQILESSSISGTDILPSNLQRRLPSYDISSEPATSLAYHFPESNTTSNSETKVATCGEDAILPLKNESGHRKTETLPEDDNSAWMKFVFDGDSEELETKAFTEAAHQAAVELLPSDSSTSTVNPTEIIPACGVESFSRDKEEGGGTYLSSSSDSHMATQGTLDSEAISSNPATAGSTLMSESESRFRFAQPRTFVGKLADPKTSTATLMSHHHSKKRGRPKKKATDGRTDIRQLPDFDGDPIEEFEDE
ncbi:hypothetical protein F4805DRAFT_274421 [Annulohypoxylon moriforme]|nr:hypothetical protein F4805DRAFT_274421 [Annulohypoxylon moriforme]